MVELKEAMKNIVDTLQSVNCEATESPYWLILDPRQMFCCDVHELASMISGPFFSRDDAQNYLTAKRHRYTKHARVYCHSGYCSQKYKELNRALEPRKS